MASLYERLLSGSIKQQFPHYFIATSISWFTVLSTIVVSDITLMENYGRKCHMLKVNHHSSYPGQNAPRKEGVFWEPQTLSNLSVFKSHNLWHQSPCRLTTWFHSKKSFHNTNTEVNKTKRVWTLQATSRPQTSVCTNMEKLLADLLYLLHRIHTLKTAFHGLKQATQIRRVYIKGTNCSIHSTCCTTGRHFLEVKTLYLM